MLKFWGNSEANAPEKSAPRYTGIERRCSQRRVGSERREMVRFEPGKEDRRSGNDRRAGINGRHAISTAQVC